MDPTLSAALLSRTVVWFTTLYPDGAPHTAPTWFIWDDDCFWISTGQSAKKVSNLALDPRVTLALDGTSAAPVVALGRAEVIDMGHCPRRVNDGFARKYGGWDITDESQYGTRVVIRIEPTRWLLQP